MPLRHLIEFHLGKLFSILLHKDIPTTVVRLYFDCYSSQNARVGWNNIMSEYLSVSNGVKQGGVHSSMLFSLYIDPLLLITKIDTIRCFMLMTLLLFVRVFGD